jgi:tetratricopeptide (TPR) repeat protein
MEQRFDDALAHLDDALESQRSAPDLQSFKCAVTVIRAKVLCLAGRYDESLMAWQERAFLGLRYPSDAYEIALGRCTCYIKMGHAKEAIKILEITLDRSDPAHLVPIRALIEKLGEAYSATKRPLPERWRRVAARVNASISPRTARRVRPLSLRSLSRKTTKPLRSP